MQRFWRVAQLVHQVQLREILYPVVAELDVAFQPLAQRAMPCRRDLVNALSGSAFGFFASAAQQAFAFEPLQRRINLAQLGSPEVMDALVEYGFQRVTAGWLAQQTQQDVLEAHSANI